MGLSMKNRLMIDKLDKPFCYLSDKNNLIYDINILKN